MEAWKLRILMVCRTQATWVPIIYLFFPESKGRELEDFDRLFAGEENAAIVERMESNGNPETLGKDDTRGVVHEERAFEGTV